MALCIYNNITVKEKFNIQHILLQTVIMPPKKRKSNIESSSHSKKKVKWEKGILGIKKDPKKPVLFSLDNALMWPSSSDTEDSDYNPGETSSRKKCDVVKYVFFFII